MSHKFGEIYDNLRIPSDIAEKAARIIDINGLISDQSDSTAFTIRVDGDLTSVIVTDEDTMELRLREEIHDLLQHNPHSRIAVELADMDELLLLKEGIMLQLGEQLREVYPAYADDPYENW